jgi:hypothetical protein
VGRDYGYLWGNHHLDNVTASSMMNTAEALERYATLQQELSTLLLLLASDDPEPLDIDACHARIAEATVGLDTIQATPSALSDLAAAASETDRLARATAEAAHQRRKALTAEQAQLERQQGALGAYRPLTGTVEAQFIDRRS